jgi:hypothetical protein
VLVSKLDAFDGSGETASEFLGALAQDLASEGHVARHVTLFDGAPAIVVSEPASGIVSTTTGVELGFYYVFAMHDGGYYEVHFQTNAADFKAEEPAVAKIMQHFIGSK